MDEKIRQKLEEHFPQNLIKQVDKGFGNIDYVEVHSVIQWLNDAFKGDWSFEVVEYFVQEKEVVVLGKLIIRDLVNGDIIKMQWGSDDIKYKQGTTKMLSFGNNLKSASSDALKKCATLLGCGLHLYQDSPKRPQKARNTPKSTQNKGVYSGASTQTPKKKKPPQISTPDRGLVLSKKNCMLHAKTKGVLGKDEDTPESNSCRKAFFDTVTKEFKLKEGQQLSANQWDELTIKLDNDKFVGNIMDLADMYYKGERDMGLFEGGGEQSG